MMHRLMHFCERQIAILESRSFPLVTWLSGFLLVLFVRALLEGMSSTGIGGFIITDLPTNLHYLTFYISMTLAFGLLLSFFAKKSVQGATRVVLLGLPVIWIAPIVDMLLPGTFRMTYIFDGGQALLTDFLSFFGPIVPIGISVGMRVEFFLLLAGIGIYILVSTKSWWRVVLGTLLGYVLIFVSTSLPSLIAVMVGSTESAASFWLWEIRQSALPLVYFHPEDVYAWMRSFELLFSAVFAQIGYVVAVALLFLWSRKAVPAVLRAVVQNIRLTRLLNYFGVYSIGVFVAVGTGVAVGIMHPLTLLMLFAGGVTLLFAWIFSVATNDLVDEPIDRVSDPSRPLVRGDLSRQEMHDVAVVSGVGAVIGGLSLGSYGFFFVAMFLALYAVYSLPPLRLKQIPLLASFLIALAHLVAMLLGFFLVSSARAFTDFPHPLALLVVLGFTLAVNVKDLKDIAGDRAAGVPTLPVLLGQEWGRVVVGGMLFLAYILVPVLLPFPYILPLAILVGGIAWWAVVKGKGERFLFLLHVCALVAFLAVFMLLRT